MPVYHFIIHAYRSWRPDHPQGYTPYHAGHHPPDPVMADDYDRKARQPEARFDARVQWLLLTIAHNICDSKSWRLEAAAMTTTHAHLLVSWVADCAWEEVDRQLKNLLALKLNRAAGTPGKRWFVRRHGSPRRVEEQNHFDHLVEVYFPGHPGVVWRRGMEIRAGIDLQSTTNLRSWLSALSHLFGGLDAEQAQAERQGSGGDVA